MDFLKIRYKGKSVNEFYKLFNDYDEIFKLSNCPLDDYSSDMLSFKLEKVTLDFIVQILGAGGIVALLNVLKNWTKSNKSIHYIDKSKGLEIKISGSLSKKEEKLINNLIKNGTQNIDQNKYLEFIENVTDE